MSSENKYSAPPTLQDAIDKAGSPMKLLWKPTAPAWTVPVVKPEYVGWSQEQMAWRETAALSDLSHHMFDLFMEGPDATRLLKAVGAFSPTEPAPEAVTAPTQAP